jgi:hypothetical protein
VAAALLSRPAVIGIALACSGVPSVAFAHGYAAPFSPPLPLAWYLAAAGTAVLVSFVVSHAVSRSGIADAILPSYGLGLGHFETQSLRHRVVGYASYATARGAQFTSVVLFLCVVGAAFVGNSNPIHNLAPTFIWVIFWIGVPIISAVFGDIWSVVNPWKILYQIAEFATERIPGHRPESWVAAYRPSWDVWPAVLLFFCFAWVENVYPDSIVPFHLGVIIVVYSAITWGGMFIFGRETWLRYGDPFSVFFSLIARCSIVQPSRRCSSTSGSESASPVGYPRESRARNTCVGKTRSESPGIRFRMPGSGVIGQGESSAALMIFVLLVLSTMTLDGFLATTIWTDIRMQLSQVVSSITLIGSLALLAAPIMFYLAFQACMALSASAGHLDLTSVFAARVFVITLLPIAVVYHIAHFHSFLLIQGQAIVPLISDPFGWGWDLFGTASYRLNPTVVSPHASWLFTVAVIVAGHVVAVYAAHAVARRRATSGTSLFRGQLPVLLLMTGYTVLSLWIMGQPMMK